MSKNEKIDPDKKLPPEDQDIQREDEILQSEKRAFLPALVGVSRKLLTSTASIKAAISSLLYDDILWDPINQHEFLEAINDSADQLSDLLTLLLLSLRAEADLIVLHPEPYLVEEILGKVKGQIREQFPQFEFELALPENNVFINTDFDYLVLLLELLIQVIYAIAEEKKAYLLTSENEGQYSLVFCDLEEDTFLCLRNELQFPVSGQRSNCDKKLSSVILLKVKLVRHILQLQKISTVFEEDPRKGKLFHLDIPIHKKGMTRLPE